MVSSSIAAARWGFIRYPGGEEKSASNDIFEDSIYNLEVCNPPPCSLVSEKSLEA
jgi:hypothetical protein